MQKEKLSKMNEGLFSKDPEKEKRKEQFDITHKKQKEKYKGARLGDSAQTDMLMMTHASMMSLKTDFIKGKMTMAEMMKESKRMASEYVEKRKKKGDYDKK